jgi:homoserine dehydrogenase
LRLVLVGFGVVGQSFAALLKEKTPELATKYGFVPRVVAILDSSGSVADDKGLDAARVIRTKNKTGKVGAASGRSTREIISGTEADVLIEATPTDFKNGEPGMGHIRSAFTSKKHVITCNKGPLGIAFQALQELARHNSVQFRYSGAVGGGTPILDFGKTCSTGDDVTRVTGILNGTCNFILNRMERDKVSFADALSEAQRAGYAEKDPTLDINGYDTAVKAVIIANHLKLSKATVRDVKVKGIQEVTAEQAWGAASKGEAVRLIASAGDDGITVGPETIQRDDPLCVVGTYNAVKFHCRSSGDKVIVGKGAGGPETASSLLRDLIEIRGAMSEKAAR